MILCALFGTEFFDLEKFKGIAVSPDSVAFFGDEQTIIAQGYEPAAYSGKCPDIAVLSECDENMLETIKNTKIVIAPSDDLNLLKRLKGKRQVITCGLKSTDTVTVSSISDEAMTIAVMRELISVSGRAICPQEVLIKDKDIKERDPFAAMAGCVLSLICR